MFTENKRVKRRYVLRARGEQVAQTRASIVEAIMRLHGEVGPRNTTVSAIAARAGVERLTVYRHFKNEAEMFTACSHRYLELNPPPDPSAWAGEPDPASRTRRGLEHLYAFFNRTAPMFEKIYRDVDEYVSLKRIMDQFDAYLRALADDLAAAWPRDRVAPRRRVILRHAAKFATWQSLEAEGADDTQKVALILHWLAEKRSASGR
jgi:AcrR family transcriptional regulator